MQPMATARSEQVDLSVTPYYHCMTRCVRRAFLCGEDHYSGKNFDHRKEWVRDRLRFLTSLFAIDVCAYAVMSNHLHVVLHVDAERADAWSEAETVRRYTTLYPMSKRRWEAKISKAERGTLLAAWRERLTSISWLMRALSEFIARKANQEEGSRGRFWEGRFKSQALLDEKGLLTCMAYVDLNPVRAGLAKSLEASDFTSIQERLQYMAKKKSQRRKQSAPKTLAALHGQAPSGQSTHIVPMSIEDYIGLLKWTGSVLAPGKRGKLATGPVTTTAPSRTTVPKRHSAQPNMLRERGISPEGWITAMRNQALGTTAFLGSVESLDALAVQRNRKWLRGIGLARQMAA
tara:strand:- start:22535 stop:23575 length:1041 start_codon:yes stop_codon:yes gene_type:complete